MGFNYAIQDIAVIGGGPCGSGLTKALVGEKAFNRIKVYERRSKAGGLWNYTPLKTNLKSNQINVPSVDPYVKIEKVEAVSGEQFYESPVYKLLDANVPKDLMAYRDHPFPENVPLFPTHQQILSYIENYSKDIEHLVTFNEEVISLQFHHDSNKWEVVSRSTVTGERTIDCFDAVAVAIGSYDKPFIPDVPGLKEFNEKFPGAILHAKSYDSPEQFRKSANILVVGNSASGADISYQLATHLDRQIYKSIRSENLMPAGKDARIKDVGDLLKFDSITKSVYFKDGFRLDNVDTVIFGTGYLKSIPFIKNEPNMITNGAKVHGLYKHLIYVDNPTLAVVGLPRFVLPTRLSEVQGCWLARAWSGRIELPPTEEMQLFNDSLEGDERNHHDLVFPKDVLYSNELNAQCLASGKDGYHAVHWDKRQAEIRGAIKVIKEAYIRYTAEYGRPVQSLKELEDLGYFKYPPLPVELLGTDFE